MFKKTNRFSNCVRLAAFGLAVLLALPASAVADNRYLLLLKEGGKANNKFSSQVEKAGGQIRLVVDEIGLVVVSSSDPGFKARAAGLRGVQEVAFSRPIRTDQGVESYQGPQNGGSHLGEDEFFYPLQWGIDEVGAPAAWNAGHTGAGATVAVLDGGIDHDNADFADNLNHGLSISFMPCDFGLNCDGDVEDWRVSEIDEYPGEYPEHGQGPFFNHGTHVAGTIAAGDNGTGGIGVAPDAEIIAVKVCTEFDTYCLDEAMLPGIVHAASVGADVINMSLGGLFDRNPKDFCNFLKEVDAGVPCGKVYVSETRAVISMYRRAISYANSMGTTLVVSAGNSALDADHTGSLLFFLADFPNVLGISATAPVGGSLPAVFGDAPPAPLASPESLAYYSNYGRTIIDFAAPGGSIELLFYLSDPFNTWCESSGLFDLCFLMDIVLSNAPGDYFFYAQGTSMAAPHAAGVAALLVGKNGGDMNPKRLHNAMKKCALDLGQRGKDPIYGFGYASAACLGD